MMYVLEDSYEEESSLPPCFIRRMRLQQIHVEGHNENGSFHLAANAF